MACSARSQGHIELKRTERAIIMMRLYEFKQLNQAHKMHWFDADTLRFFKSRISNWDVITGYFISSERGPNDQRLYSIRKGNFETGNVTTIGQFQQYTDIRTAKRAIKNLLRGTK